MKIGELNITAIAKKELPEEVIEDFRKGCSILIYVYCEYNLSENLIREFQDKVNWYWISIEQNLSEDFIREFQDRVNWDNICYKQNLSKEFIMEFVDKIVFDSILDNENISKEVKDYCRMFL